MAIHSPSGASRNARKKLCNVGRFLPDTKKEKLAKQPVSNTGEPSSWKIGGMPATTDL